MLPIKKELQEGIKEVKHLMLEIGGMFHFYNRLELKKVAKYN